MVKEVGKMIKCVQCDNPAFEHNGKIYQLCAVCGLKAICSLLGWKYDKDTSKEKGK